MELTQLEQMIRWLDEERKRDKAQIAALQERAEALGIGVSVDSRMGHGTRIRMTCPWRTDS